MVIFVFLQIDNKIWLLYSKHRIFGGYLMEYQ